MPPQREALTEPLSIAYKRISAVEAAPMRSNQHEFNGTEALKQVLGREARQNWPTRWVFLDDIGEPRLEFHDCSWYDARASHPSRSEWRLYFKDHPEFAEDDFLVVVRREREDELLLLVARSGSVPWQQLRSLLEVEHGAAGGFKYLQLVDVDPAYSGMLSDVLEFAGWMPYPFAGDHRALALLFEEFPGGFPETKRFSEFARGLVEGAYELNPDERLWNWYRKEEQLFRALEHHELQEKLSQRPPFSGVEDFLKFSLSIQNRRKSRAGHALEHHFEALLRSEAIQCSRGKMTEGVRKPDFILPSIDLYHDPGCPEALLSMVGVKTSCKDRWRQILTEASRIKAKHLLTLEPSISGSQLQEMSDESVILVAPEVVRRTYSPPSALRTCNVTELVAELKSRQRAANDWSGA